MKTAPVLKQLPAKKQSVVAAKQTNESSDSSDDDEDDTVKSKTSEPDAKVENNKVINFLTFVGDKMAILFLLKAK